MVRTVRVQLDGTEVPDASEPYDFEAILMAPPTPDHLKGKAVGAEEIKDGGVLTSRVEYDSDGIETTNVDNPPLGSEVEKRRRQREAVKPVAAVTINDLPIEIAAPSTARHIVPTPDDNDSDSSSPIMPPSPTSNKTPKKKGSKASSANTTSPSKRAGLAYRFGRPFIPWHTDEHEWTKNLIANNLDAQWKWYAEQNRLRFEGTRYTDQSGLTQEPLRGVRSTAAVRERFQAWKKLCLQKGGREV